MSEILDILRSGGPYGVIAVLLWAVRELDARTTRQQQAHQLALQQAQASLQAEHEKRLEDQRAATQALLALNDRVHVALDRAADLIEVLNSTTQTRSPK